MELNEDELNASLDQVLPNIRAELKEYGVHTFYIAGGFIRDTLLGRPVKDIDIFVPSVYAGTLPTAGGLNFEKPLEEYIDQEVLSVYSFEISSSNLPCEVIVLGPSCGEDIEDVMKRFDTNLCKAAAFDSGDVVKHPDFIRDVENKTITIVRSNGATPDRLRERIRRLKEKYDYEVIDLEGFLEDELAVFVSLT